PQLGAGESQPFQRHTGRFIEIGESDAETPGLGPCGAETTGEQSRQENSSPQTRQRCHALLNRLDVRDCCSSSDATARPMNAADPATHGCSSLGWLIRFTIVWLIPRYCATLVAQAVSCRVTRKRS